MAKRPRIAVVGSANIDLTTFTDRFPRPGETIFGQKFDLGFGGKGANQAVAARLCGADVFMVARVGSDLTETVREGTGKRGIRARLVQVIAIAFDSRDKVLDVAENYIAFEYLNPGQDAPFSVYFNILKTAPARYEILAEGHLTE